MGSSKPKVMQTPFEQKNVNTFEYRSPSDTPEAKSYLNTPLDFGSGGANIKTNFDIDPGVGRRTDLAEQAMSNRWNSAFMGGVPSFIRQAAQDRERREIRSQGAAEAQQAQYAQQQAEYGASVTKAQMDNDARIQQTLAELERRRQLLPQLLQTGGNVSGFGSQVVQPQPGFWQQLAIGAVSGAAGGLSAKKW